MMRKVFTRLLSVILAVAIITTFLPQSYARAASELETGTRSEFHVQKSDGDYLYKMQVSEDKLSYQVTMTNISTGESTLVVYDNGIASTYNNTDENSIKADQVPDNIVDYNESSSSSKATEFSVNAYRAETRCLIPTLGGNHLWYRMGNTSTDLGYMLMGCDWTYRVKATACDDCKDFRTQLILSNSLVAKCGLTDTVAIAVGVAVLLAGPTGGLSVAMAMGLTGGAAYFMVDACTAEQAAHTSYDVAKAYGVRQ